MLSQHAKTYAKRNTTRSLLFGVSAFIVSVLAGILWINIADQSDRSEIVAAAAYERCAAIPSLAASDACFSAVEDHSVVVMDSYGSRCVQFNYMGRKNNIEVLQDREGHWSPRGTKLESDEQHWIAELKRMI